MAHLPATECSGSAHPDAHLLPSVIAVLDQHAWRRGHLVSAIEAARAELRRASADPGARFVAAHAIRTDRLSLRYLRQSQTRLRGIRDTLAGARA